MSRPFAKNKDEQENIREACIWMMAVLRERPRTNKQNPLKQGSMAARMGISQTCLSRWLSGETKTIQKPGAWEALIGALCEARGLLPEAGWVIKPFLYADRVVIRTLDFKSESLWRRVAQKELDVPCDHYCRTCHGLTPQKGFFCMHCGSVVSPRDLDEDMGEFLLEGDSWAIDINDLSRVPLGCRQIRRRSK